MLAESDVSDGSTVHDCTLSEDVIQVVAAARDVDATDLEPLYNVVDPDALDSLLSCSDDSVEISFEYAGCEVTVTSDAVTVDR